MEEHRIGCFPELHEVLSRFSSDVKWVFRGHESSNWKLIPKVGRSQFRKGLEKRMFESWKRRAVQFVDPRVQTIGTGSLLLNITV